MIARDPREPPSHPGHCFVSKGSQTRPRPCHAVCCCMKPLLHLEAGARRRLEPDSWQGKLCGKVVSRRRLNIMIHSRSHDSRNICVYMQCVDSFTRASSQNPRTPRIGYAVHDTSAVIFHIATTSYVGLRFNCRGEVLLQLRMTTYYIILRIILRSARRLQQPSICGFGPQVCQPAPGVAASCGEHGTGHCSSLRYHITALCMYVPPSVIRLRHYADSEFHGNVLDSVLRSVLHRILRSQWKAICAHSRNLSAQPGLKFEPRPRKTCMSSASSEQMFQARLDRWPQNLFVW
jgi:hypothetical protein